MITITQRYGIGYRGKLGERPWLARLTGTESRFGRRREFLDADRVTRDHWNRARYIRTLAYNLGPGLYEEQSEGNRRMCMVWVRQGETTWTSRISDERVDAMLALMDAGEEFDAARRATRTPR